MANWKMMTNQLIPQKGQTWYLKDPANQINPKKYSVQIIDDVHSESMFATVAYRIGSKKDSKSYVHPLDQFLDLYCWIED